MISIWFLIDAREFMYFIEKNVRILMTSGIFGPKNILRVLRLDNLTFLLFFSYFSALTLKSIRKNRWMILSF